MFNGDSLDVSYKPKKELDPQNTTKEPVNNYLVQTDIPLMHLINSKRDTSMFKTIVSKYFYHCQRHYK